jgi:hypothetical protein
VFHQFWQAKFVEPTFATGPAASKDDACFKSSQSRLKNNHFDEKLQFHCLRHISKQVEHHHSQTAMFQKCDSLYNFDYKYLTSFLLRKIANQQ